MPSKPITIAAIIILSTIFIPSPAKYGNSIIHVGGSGDGNYSSIQEAINAAGNGDTIFVYNDSSPYYEHILVNKSVRIVGEDKNTTIIDGNGNGTVVNITAPNVILRNFMVRKSGTDYESSGIECTGYGLIENNIISMCGNGITLRKASDVELRNNKITECTKCIYILYSSSNIIENNYAKTSFGSVFYMHNSSGNEVKNNIFFNSAYGSLLRISGNGNLFLNNTIKSNNHIGISMLGNNNIMEENSFINSGLEYFYDYYHNIFINNTVNDKPLVYMENVSNTKIEEGGEIVLVNCENVRIENVDIHNTSIGIFLFNSQGCIISSSNISLAATGIHLFKSSNCSIESSVIYKNDYAGIEIAPFSRDNEIKNCMIYDNSRGISMWDDYNAVFSNHIFKNWEGVELFYGCNNNTIHDNEMDNNTEGITVWQENSWNNIEGNSIHHNKRGITLSYECKYNSIIANEIYENKYGIQLSSSSDGNSIYENNFLKNKVGIWLTSKWNKISHNNFIGNDVHATFLYGSGEIFHINNWNRNYWGRARFLPKPIFGIRFPLPWINFDWLPLKFPYEK